ncbi:hypothetical protein ACJRO7_028706 [Eucalyptus globulus]|uniref:RING-type E3 ubiquitin transferase n=1 Tax=Eucalyptus globulus TaxID=34317 RepID=A0ABD3K1C8_EUCGL
MNSSSSSSGGGSSDGSDINPFTDSMMFTIGCLILVLAITLSSYYCIRANHRAGIAARITRRHLDALLMTGAGGGIDEAMLQSYPTILFSSVKHHEKIGGCSCSICLGEYEESDVLRLLPECGHFFHMECVDPWLRLHATCPVCRKSPVSQLGHPGLEPETVAVRVDGDLHSGDR